MYSFLWPTISPLHTFTHHSRFSTDDECLDNFIPLYNDVGITKVNSSQGKSDGGFLCLQNNISFYKLLSVVAPGGQIRTFSNRWMCPNGTRFGSPILNSIQFSDQKCSFLANVLRYQSNLPSRFWLLAKPCQEFCVQSQSTVCDDKWRTNSFQYDGMLIEDRAPRTSLRFKISTSSALLTKGFPLPRERLFLYRTIFLARILFLLLARFLRNRQRNLPAGMPPSSDGV